MLDCTVGGGNHAEKVLSEFTNSRLVGLDIDPDMVALASQKLEPFIEQKRALVFHTNYTGFDNLDVQPILDRKLFGSDKDRYDVIFADLGFNSYQVSTPDRGFSFMLKGELDMRYDRSRADTPTCADIVRNVGWHLG